MKQEAAEASPFSMDRIVMSEFDRRRLHGLLALLRERARVGHHTLDALAAGIERADVVRPEEVPRDVVTMNSEVEIVNLDTRETLCVTVVFPGVADVVEGRVSVLAPLGLALLGCREGDEFTLPPPGPARRFQLRRIVYQPEAAGRFDF